MSTRGTLSAVAPELCGVPCFKAGLVAQLRAGLPSNEALDDIRTRFVALSDRRRLKVLCALVEGGELCVGDVAHVVGMSVSAASHHLRKLRDLRILKYQDRAPRRPRRPVQRHRHAC